MKIHFKHVLVICMAAGLMTGCGETVPDLTPDQQMQVTEYAVDTLLKYSKLYSNSRLVELEPEKEEVVSGEIPEAEPEQETAEEMEEEQPWMIEPDEEEQAEEESNEPVYSTVSMDTFMGLQGVSFDYSGYRVTNAYPSDSENAYFSMTASEGKKLLVLEFELKNTGSDPVAVDLNRIDVNFSFADNGGKKYKLQHTMVENDIYGFSGNLESGETRMIAGIVEMPAEETEQIAIPSLTMTKGDEKAMILLQ